MAIILQDNFTDTAGVALPSHAPQVGTWVYGRQFNAGGAPTYIISDTNDTFLSAASNSTVSSVVSGTDSATVGVTVTVDLVKRSAAVPVASGIIACFNNTNYNHYLGRLITSGTPTWQLFKWNGNTPVSLGTSTAGASSAVGTYTLRLSVSDAGAILFEYSTNGGSTWNTAVSANDATPLVAGRVGLHMADTAAVGTNTTGHHFDNFLAVDSVPTAATAYSLSANPTSVSTGVSTTITASSNGNLASPVTITLSDGTQGGTFSGTITLPAGNQTVGSATYSNATAKSVTITGTNTGGLTNGSTNVTITAPLVNLAPGAANYFLSPYSWVVSSGLATSNCAGSYVKIRFTGSTSASVAVNVAALVSASVAAGDYPWVRWVVNDGNWQQTQLNSGTTSISLATGLTPATTYDIQLYFWRVGNFNLDRWTNPVNALRLGNFSIDNGGSFSAPPLKSKRVLIYGDSITEGLSLLSTSPPHSATDGFAFHLANSLSAEYGVRGFGSQGWEANGVGNAPKFTTAWNSFSNANSLLTGGLLTPTPDFIFVVQGTNDGLNAIAPATVQSAVQAWLSSARSAAAANCWIYVCVPFGGFQRSAITAGVNAYITANPSDTRVKLIDLGTDAERGITAFALGASAFSTDGIHPTQFNHARLGAMLANQATTGTAVVRTGTTTLTQSVTRGGTNLSAANVAITGSVFDVAGTTVYYYDTTGVLSWKKGQASFLNTLPGTNKDEIPAYASFQVFPGAAITVQNSQFSFGSVI